MTSDKNDSELEEILLTDKDEQKLYIAFQLGVGSAKAFYLRGFLSGFFATTVIYILCHLFGVG